MCLLQIEQLVSLTAAAGASKTTWQDEATSMQEDLRSVLESFSAFSSSDAQQEYAHGSLAGAVLICNLLEGTLPQGTNPQVPAGHGCQPPCRPAHPGSVSMGCRGQVWCSRQAADAAKHEGRSLAADDSLCVSQQTAGLRGTSDPHARQFQTAHALASAQLHWSEAIDLPERDSGS